jgi:uncharacterized protein YifE (UPF0438 family)
VLIVASIWIKYITLLKKKKVIHTLTILL